jgi:4-amino-4-deoxy-L-arabinose transferase-like glycosyltransferase
MRLPRVMFLLVFAYTVFHFVRKELGTRMGILAAMMFLTNGRVLFYESMHGLIDITFSWLTYLFFMASYRLMRQGRILAVFLVSYAITAVSYLMKGLPSLVFCAISLLVLFISQKKFKSLLSWKHIAGIAVLVVIVGSYYLIYFMRNHIAAEDVFSTLLGETTRRTVIRFGVWQTILHLITFPLEMFYHFFPWTILAILFFRKGSLKLVRSHPFLNYNLLIIVFNIILYWTSPEVHPRYILMLIPLLYTIIGWLYLEYRQQGSVWTKVLDIIFLGMLVLATFGTWAPMFVDPAKTLPMIGLICTLLFLFMVLVTYTAWKEPAERILWVAIALLVIRAGFNFIIQPARELESLDVKVRDLGRQIGRETAGKELYVWWNPKKPLDPYYGKKRTDYPFLYYIVTERDEVVRYSSEMVPGRYYIANPADIKGLPAVVHRDITPYEKEKPLVLITFDTQ